MPSDRSRRTDGLRDAYTGVVAQQGRVTLDRDFNAEHGFVAGRIEGEARDVIGPCGTPDDGFAISVPQTSPPGPPLWSPPPPLSPPAPHALDFLISPGTMYVGGERAVLEARPAGEPVTYSYYDQPDWIAPSTGDLTGILRGRGHELVFLSLAEQEVSAVEDPDLLEVALGGPDTTQRLRLLRRVRREPVEAADCVTAWAEAVALWRAQYGLVLDPKTMQLRPEVRLEVGFSAARATPDPCDPIAQNGYLGAENQTIRVEISDAGNPGSPGGQATLLWGYDNASFLYRAAPLASNPAILTIAPSPPDAFHIPQAGQAVEILRTAAVLGSEPDMTDPTGQRSIVRCVAQPNGIVRRLTQPYGPVNPGDPVSYIVLDQPLPADYLADATPLFLRVWQSAIAFDPAGDTVLLTDDVTGASTGVEVTISVPQGEVLTRGTYWLLAVRPSTPQAVYPGRLLTAPQPPDGPRLWACPLAVIDWKNLKNPIITDCRNHFDNLVELTRRRTGCCTIAVSPGDLANGIGLQAAVDHAAQLQPGATVCLAPGSYALAAPLRLTGAHAGIMIKNCGGAAVLTALPGSGAAFADGLITLTDTSGIKLCGLTIQPVAAPLPQLATIETLIGVHAADASDLTLDACTIELGGSAGDTAIARFGAGLFLQGDCSGLKVIACSFASSIPPTFHRQASPTPTPAPAPPTGLARSAVTSPPDVRAATALLDLARASLATIERGSAAADATTAANALIATVGCFAMSKPAANNDAGSVDCRLGAAAVRDSTFSNLTMAFYGMADIDTLRLQDNDAAQCIGGFWLQLTGWQVPQDPKAAVLFSPVWPAAEAFTERLLLDAIGLTYPLPQGAMPGAVGTAVIGPASLFIIGNQVEPVPATANGSTALLILGNRPVTQTGDASVSLVVSSNRLRSRSGPQAPTVLLLTPEQERCAITGNLILSENAPGSDPGPSLWLVPDSISLGTPGTQLLSVAGNVLQGRSDLAELTRAGVTPPQTWAVYNAAPS